MTPVVIVLSFALLWSVLVGELGAYNLLVGGALATLLLSVLRTGDASFAVRLWGFIRFLLRFVWELLSANVQVALLALQPKPRLHPHIIAVPLRLQSDAGISLLSATITLLPGTVAMGVSSDHKLLYAHAINIAEVALAKDSITLMETYILRFMT